MLGWLRRSMLLVVPVTLVLAGCVNLAAVREFASSSARMTDYKAVTDRYVTSADRQLADLPADPQFKVVRKRLETLRQITADDKATLLKLHTITTGYMSALAGLAGDDVYTLSPEIDKVSGSIVASEQLKIDDKHVQAFGNIAKRVTSWMLAAKQAKDIKQMLKGNGEDMDSLLEAMQIATDSYGIVLEQETASSLAIAEYRELQWQAPLSADVSVTPGRREVIATLLRRSAVAEAAAQASAIKRQQAAVTGLAEVREAHRSLVDNVDRLNSKEIQALLRKASADLKAIRASVAEL